MTSELAVNASIDPDTNPANEETTVTQRWTPGNALIVPIDEREQVADRFWEKVDKRSAGECWLWRKALKKKGYGRFHYKGKTVHAHRMAYALAKGPVTTGLGVCHTCNVRNCCNPGHLFLGTTKENVTDMISNGRHSRGERHGKSKLTSEAVEEIRQRHGERLEALAQRHRVHTSTVARVRNGETWKDTRVGQSQRAGVYPLLEVGCAEAAKSPSTLGESRPLDVHKWSNAPWTRELGTYVYFQLFGECQGRRAHRRWRHLVVILMDLFLRNQELSDGFLGISLDRSNRGYKGGRYNQIGLSYRHTRRVIYALTEAGYVDLHKGFRNPATGVRRQSRIRASHALLDLFDVFGLIPDTSFDEYYTEAIILKDEHKRKIDYEDTDTTRRYRQFVDSYNAALSRIHLELDWKGLAADGIGIQSTPNFSRKRVYRVFNNSSWELGGRFYGPWWQSIESDARRRILINSHPTSEVDYSAIHIVILYAKMGLDYAKQFGDDPYSLESDYPETWCSGLRRLAKDALLILVNAADRKAAIKAIQLKARFNKKTREYVAETENIVNALVKKHAPISKFFFSSAGCALQFEDARIAQSVIGLFIHRERPILSIHDSFVVMQGDADFLRETMTLAGRAYIKDRYGIDVTPALK